MKSLRNYVKYLTIYAFVNIIIESFQNNYLCNFYCLVGPVVRVKWDFSRFNHTVIEDWISVSLCFAMLVSASMASLPLWLRHNERTVSNHRRFDYLLNCLFRRRSKKTSKLRVTGLSVGIQRWLAQRASNAENVSTWWRHHYIKTLSAFLAFVKDQWIYKGRQ